MLRWSAEAEAILSRIGGDLPPLRFVDRVGEARKIIIGHPPTARGVFHPGITILYGPRGVRQINTAPSPLMGVQRR